MRQRALELGICGSYGGMNLGDEAILTVIIDEVRRRLPVSVTVLARHPADTLARHRVERAAPVRELSRADLEEEVARLDLLVIGGGGILYDGEAPLFLRAAEAAARRGVPFVTWSVGVGPLDTPHDRDLVRRVLEQAHVVTVRDRRSRLLLEEVGLEREVHVTADPGLLLEPAPFTDAMLEREGIDPAAPLIGVATRGGGSAAPDLDATRCRSLLAEAIDFVTARTGATVLFVPMERDDLSEAHRIAARLARPARVRFLSGRYSASEVRGLVARLRLAIGMRLHFLIFAAAARVPLVGLSYSSKVQELLRELDVPQPHVHDVRAGRLLARIDRAWDEHGQHPPQLEERVEALERRARETGDLVAQVLSQRPGPASARHGAAKSRPARPPSQPRKEAPHA